MSDKTKVVSKVAAFKDGKMLMGKRRDDKKWCFPGGHCNDGEAPDDGAVRELAEETGLVTDSVEPVVSKTVKDGKVKVHGFRAEVLGNPDSSDDPDSEFIEFRWVSPDAVPSEIANNLHSKPDVLLDALGKPEAWSKMTVAA